MGVRGSGVSPLSTRPVEALMADRGVAVEHATIHRWVSTYSPPLAAAFHRRPRPPGGMRMKR